MAAFLILFIRQFFNRPDSQFLVTPPLGRLAEIGLPVNDLEQRLQDKVSFKKPVTGEI